MTSSLAVPEMKLFKDCCLRQLYYSFMKKYSSTGTTFLGLTLLYLYIYALFANSQNNAKEIFHNC